MSTTPERDAILADLETRVSVKTSDLAEKDWLREVIRQAQERSDRVPPWARPTYRPKR